MSVVLQTGVMHYRENEQDQWRPLIIKAQSIDFEALVDPYEPTVPKAWLKGEYCLQDDKIWRCVRPVTTPAEFDEDDWVQTTFGYEIEQLGVAVQDSEPNFSKVWIDTDETTSVTCPDMSEFNALENSLNTKADEESLALRRSGATNTGAQIENGTYFYLDGTLKQAIATIAQNASFTDQNCETVTAGGLNDLKNEIDNRAKWKLLATTTTTTETELTLKDSAKFSDYKYLYLYLVLNNGSQIQGAASGPRDMLITYSQANPVAVNTYTTARFYGTFRYVSDTKVKLLVSNSSYRIDVYGVL